MSNPCPICGNPGGCATYPLMVERWAAGRDREHWRRIHDHVNMTPLVAGVPEAAAYPSFVAMATSAVTTAFDFAAGGFALSDQPEVERRLAICGECEHFDAAQARCRACGCFMSLKTRLASTQCPIGKW